MGFLSLKSQGGIFPQEFSHRNFGIQAPGIPPDIPRMLPTPSGPSGEQERSWDENSWERNSWETGTKLFGEHQPLSQRARDGIPWNSRHFPTSEFNIPDGFGGLSRPGEAPGELLALESPP